MGRNNICYIASAGAGKTTKIVEDAVNNSVFQSFYIFVLAVRPDLPAYCSAKVTDNSCTLQILTACGGRRKSSFSGRSVFLSPDLSGCRYHIHLRGLL